MRKIKRKLANPWGNTRGRIKRIKPKTKDKIGYNHAYNKLGGLYTKASIVKRKWKNPKPYYGNNKNKAMKRKRYFV